MIEGYSRILLNDIPARSLWISTSTAYPPGCAQRTDCTFPLLRFPSFPFMPESFTACPKREQRIIHFFPSLPCSQLPCIRMNPCLGRDFASMSWRTQFASVAGLVFSLLSFHRFSSSTANCQALQDSRSRFIQVWSLGAQPWSLQAQPWSLQAQPWSLQPQP